MELCFGAICGLSANALSGQRMLLAALDSRCARALRWRVLASAVSDFTFEVLMSRKTRNKIVRTSVQIVKVLAIRPRMSGIEPDGDLRQIDRDLKRLRELVKSDTNNEFEQALGRFQANVLKYAIKTK